MKIQVIKVTQNGKTGYLRSTNMFFPNGPIVENPLEATNYLIAENNRKLKQDLDYLRLPSDEWFARSGLLVDTAYLVEFDVDLQETSCVEAREPHKQS